MNRSKILATIVVAATLVISLACQSLSAAPSTNPSGEQLMGTVVAAITATANAMPQVSASTPMPVSTSTMVPTTAPVSVVAGPHTADQVRATFETGTLKWVSGGEGSYVAGGQGMIVKDLVLADIPEGMTVEVFCVQYSNFNGQLNVKKVCPDAKEKFSGVIPAGTPLTIWLDWAVQGSLGETFPEGFKNQPCLCQDGDCRDE